MVDFLPTGRSRRTRQGEPEKREPPTGTHVWRLCAPVWGTTRLSPLSRCNARPSATRPSPVHISRAAEGLTGANTSARSGVLIPGSLT